MNEDIHMNNMIDISQYGLRGSNFYWNKHEAKGITKEEVMAVGVTSDKVELHRDIIPNVLAVDRELREHGYSLFIKEGYRSEELYRLVYEKRCIKFGKEETDKIFNMTDMPHATGKSLDATLWSLDDDKEVWLRSGEDGTDALFYGFYKDKNDEQSKEYQRLQDLLVKTFLNNGCRLGTKNEYFHFDFVTD